MEKIKDMEWRNPDEEYELLMEQERQELLEQFKKEEQRRKQFRRDNPL